ncbi:MAG TPA: LON peptidase substrate-binding domain-containing protein [Candidatus Binataceae bacterium]|nr:LON peptidase substrate-binding domain-containing protein [Candidatus Binataceae bacterium]
MADLPHIIPIFPLPNFVLFPGLSVPLHIFEPRYREMVADVAQTHATIGMMMLKGDWERDYYAYPDIYPMGCAGKIAAASKLPNGRFNLILEGISEFRIVREIRERSYRLAEVEWCTVAPASLDFDEAAMMTLHNLLVTILGDAAGEVWKSLVEERGLRGAALINSICFHLDIAPIEKQTLLEAGETRGSCLLDVLTFKAEERKLGPRGAGGAGPGPTQ